jgi:hypothetical protein
MRMMMLLGRSIMLGVGLAALVSCGDAKEEPVPGPTNSAIPDPDLTGPAPASDASRPPQSCEATSYCSGPLVVRSDNLALNRKSDQLIEVVGTLSFENRSTSDLKVAILEDNLVLNTDKGIKAEQNSRYVSGLGICKRDGSECFDAAPDTFRLIAPGDSPAKLNISLSGSFQAAQAPLVGQIESGTLTLLAYTVAADGSRQVHRIALAKTPISNQVAQ